MPQSCGIGGDAFWLIWDAAAGRQLGAQRLGPGAGRRRRGGPARAGHDDAPAARTARDHRPGRGPLVGRRPRAVRAAVAADAPRPGHRAGRATGSRRGTRFIDAVERTRAADRVDARARRAGFLRGLPAARPAVAAGRAGPPAGAGGDARSARRRRASTRSTTATSARARHAGWLPPAARSRSPTCATTPRPGPSRSRSTTAASGSRPIRPTAPGSSPSSSWPSSSSFEPPAAGGVRPGRGDRRRAGSTLGIEAAKLAMADRDAHLTDPDVATSRSSACSIRRYAAELAARIDPRRAAAPGRVPRTRGWRHGLPRGRRRATATRSASSSRTTWAFGSGVRRSGDRDPLPEPRQLLQPRPRRTRTSSRPASGRSTRCSPGCCSGTAWPTPWVVAGSMGGDAQPQIHAQLVSAPRRRRARRRDRRVGAALVRRAGRRTSTPPVEVRLEPRHAAGDPRGARGARPPGDRGRPRSTAASATSTRSSSSTAGRRARRLARGRHRPAQRRAARGLVTGRP